MCENAVYRLVLSRCAIFTVYSVVPYGKGGRRYCSGLTLNQDKATKPQTVQIVRQGEVTPYWFKVNPLYICRLWFDGTMLVV